MSQQKLDFAQRLQDLFEAALDREPQERARFVADACDGDRQLQGQLEALLAADDQTGQLLDSSPAVGMDLVRILHEQPTSIPEQIGRYKIRRVIATGGMGTVYEAQQQQPRRTVALKVMRWSIASPSAQRRFEYESELLARLQHPGIAQVFEAGTHQEGTEPVPYFAMEYIPEAKSITEYADQENLGLRQRLELLAQVCDAVEYAHQKGIIHRDLKPSNILVDVQRQPRVIDFGVARATDADLAVTGMRTETGQLIGTLQYMSPEQCAADPHNIDTRSDVYTLGVVLYELLCGKLPYDVTSVTLHEATRIVREQPPPKLRTIDTRLRGDVETIVQKALEKDREHRYRSAAELADDVRRYLTGAAILARPPSVTYQLRVFARRNKVLVGGVAAVFVALTLGIVGTGVGMVRAGRKADEADQARAEAREGMDFLCSMVTAANPGRARGGKVTILSMLDAAGQKLDAGALSDQPMVEAEVRATIGNALFQNGRWDLAERHLRAAVEIHRRQLQDQRPDTLRVAMFFAQTLEVRGKLQEAERLARDNLEIARRVLPGDSGDHSVYLCVLGRVLTEKGEYGEAEPLLREALAIARKAYDNRGQQVAVPCWGLGKLLSDRGEFAEAETLLREAVEKRTAAAGQGNVHAGRTRLFLGECLARMGRYEQAEQELRQSYDVIVAAVGTDHPFEPEARRKLVALYEVWEKPEQAARWRAKLPEEPLPTDESLEKEQPREVGNGPDST